VAFASPTDSFTATDLAAMVREIWSDMVLEKRFENLTISNFVTDLSSYVSADGDTVHVPDIFTNALTVSTQATQGAGIVDASPAQNDILLLINLHKYVAWVIGDKDMKQLAKMYSLNDKYVSEARKLLMQALEVSLFTLYTDIATNTTGDALGVVTDLHIRTALQKLDQTNFPHSECAFFFDPATYWLQIAAIQKYYDKSINGRESPVVTGNFGPNGAGNQNYRGVLYGIDVYTSPSVVKATNVAKNILTHKEAFSFAIQTVGSGMVRSQVAYLPQNLATLAVCDIIYGVKTLREAAAVLINSLTTSTTA
jgi:hypothetical protein